MVNIRKLVAVDMVIHGTRFIVAEFAFGIVGLLILGLFSIRSGLIYLRQPGWETVLGFWLISIAANYIPLFIYAVIIARRGTVQVEGQPELAHVKKYTVQQVIIFVPFMVLILAIIQEARSKSP